LHQLGIGATGLTLLDWADLDAVRGRDTAARLLAAEALRQAEMKDAPDRLRGR
jgi:hypothetical protein